jgi:hypothetical protein
MHRLLTLTFALGLTLCFSSCSIGFNRDWTRAAATNATAPASLEGAWKGTWISEVNGHHGQLRAVVTAIPGKTPPSDYDFRYHATYKTILSGSYTTRHHVDAKGALSGSQDLGSLVGGVFTYEGKVTPTEFRATYKSSSDHGLFEMKRP